MASQEQGRAVPATCWPWGCGGPLREPGLRIGTCSISREKAWRKQDGGRSGHHPRHRPAETAVYCLGSDPGAMHGRRPLLVLADEPAQWERAKRDRALAALRTGLGKTPHSRLVALGTRPSSPSHWFSKMLAGGAGYAQCRRGPRVTRPSIGRGPPSRPSLDADRIEDLRTPAVIHALPGFEALG